MSDKPVTDKTESRQDDGNVKKETCLANRENSELLSKRNANDNKVEAGLPSIELCSKKDADDNFKPIKPTNPMQEAALHKLHESLKEKTPEEMRRQIEEESKNGVYGAASRKAFGHIINALENKAGLKIGIDIDKIPTIGEQKKVDELGRAIGLHEFIGKNNLPKGWLQGFDKNPWKWGEKAAVLVGIALTTRDYVQAMDELNKASHDRNFPLVLPHGTEIERDNMGKLTRVKVDLPQTLDFTNPANEAKFDRLVNWLSEFGPQMDQAQSEIAKALKNPENILQWGDEEVDREKGYTLREHRFDVKRDENGKIVVNQSIQNRDAWGYNNYFGGNVGAAETHEIKYDPKDWVPVRVGELMKVVRAEDLEAVRFEQMSVQRSEKILTPVTDLIMLGIGLGELGLAAKGGMTLGREAGGLAGKGIFNTALGASGWFNNADSRQTEAGKFINHAREWGFFAQAGIGFINTTATFGKWGTRLEKIGNLAGNAYLPLLGIQMSEELQAKSAERYRPENINTLLADHEAPESESPIDRQNVKGIDTDSLLKYGDVLGQGREPKVRNQINAIICETLAAMNGTPEQKAAMRDKLAAGLAFSKKEIERLEGVADLQLTGDELNSLVDPKASHSQRLKPSVQREADRILSERDADVMRATKLALLALSGDQDVVGSSKTHIDESTRRVEMPNPINKRNRYHIVQVLEHDIDQKIESNRLQHDLMREFEKSLDADRRKALAEAMYRAGYMKPNQYRFVMNSAA